MPADLRAECHKRRGYTDSVFAGCMANSRVPFPSDLRLDRKKVIEVVLPLWRMASRGRPYVRAARQLRRWTRANGSRAVLIFRRISTRSMQLIAAFGRQFGNGPKVSADTHVGSARSAPKRLRCSPKRTLRDCLAIFGRESLHSVLPGEVTEWSIVLVSKTSRDASPSGVRISPSPLAFSSRAAASNMKSLGRRGGVVRFWQSPLKRGSASPAPRA